MSATSVKDARTGHLFHSIKSQEGEHWIVSHAPKVAEAKRYATVDIYVTTSTIKFQP